MSFREKHTIDLTHGAVFRFKDRPVTLKAIQHIMSHLVAHADAHIAGNANHFVIGRYGLGLTGDIAEQVMAHLITMHGHGRAVDLITDQFGCMHAKAGGQDTGAGRGAAATLDMTGHHCAGLKTGRSLQFLGNAMGNAVEAFFSTLGGSSLIMVYYINNNL